MERRAHNIVFVLSVLSITQLIGWGTLSLPAVLGERFAHELGISLSDAFAGTATMLIVGGFTSPLIANIFVRHGARLVMAAGSLIAAPGFWILSAATGPLGYFAGWVVLGVASAAMLGVASYILLNELEGARAKRSIGALMLVTGLSSSIFWPITSALSALIGWRLTVAGYGAIMVLVCFPLHYFCLPLRAAPARFAAATVAPRPPLSRQPFYLLVGVIMLIGFVNWGLSSIIIQLLKAMRVDDLWALWIGSLLGLLQTLARMLDFFGSRRWDELTTGMAAGIVLPISFLLLILCGPTNGAIAAFVLLYGTANGAMSIARATLPLVFYDRDAFARVSSQIALPSNLAAAVAPPTLAAVLTSFGSTAVLVVGFVSTALALIMLLALIRLRRRMLAAGLS